MKTKTSWREKLERHKEIKIVDNPKGGTMLIPRGVDVDAAIRKVRRGRLLTVGELRSQLAEDAGADTACPLVTGIMVRVAAEAAAEQQRAGKERVTPYWRVVTNDGGLMEKLPGGRAQQASRLAGEGWRIIAGKKVVDFGPGGR